MQSQWRGIAVQSQGRGTGDSEPPSPGMQPRSLTRSNTHSSTSSGTASTADSGILGSWEQRLEAARASGSKGKTLTKRASSKDSSGSLESFDNRSLRGMLAYHSSKSTGSNVLWMGMLLNSNALHFGIGTLAWFDIVLLLWRVETFSKKEEGEALPQLAVLQASLLFVFIIELLGQFWFVNRSCATCANDSQKKEITWFSWDAFLILLSVLLLCIYGLDSHIAVLPRMPRVFRVFYSGKYYEYYKPIRMLLGTLVHSLASLLCGSVLLALIIVFFAIIGMQGLQSQIEQAMDAAAVERFGAQTVEDCQYAFSSLIPSISTLIFLAAGGQLHDVAYPIVVEVPSSLAFFVAYFLIMLVVIVGTMFSAIHNGFSTWESAHQWMDKAQSEQMKARMTKRIQEVFQSIDTDHSGSISWQEFYHNRNCNPDLKRILEKYDLDDSDVDWIWSILDVNQSGSVNQQEFVDLMWRLTSGEFKFTIMKTGHLTSQLYSKVDSLQRQMSESVQQLLTEQRKCMAVVARHDSRKSSKASTKSVSGSCLLNEQGEDEKIDEEEDPLSDVEFGHEPSIKVDRRTSIPRSPSESALTESLGARHLRGVPADSVAKYGRFDVIEYWSCGSLITEGATEKHFQMSSPCNRCDFFVSHCWSAPKDWDKYFNPSRMYETYEYKKTQELYSALDHFTSKNKHKKQLSDVTLWIDKSCIPQKDPEAKALCVSLIEEFVKLSDGFIVLLSWHYFSRLWCIYEWACFLRLRHPRDAVVSLGCDAFLKAHPGETLPRYLESIENLSVKGAQCFDPDDHAILEEKVFLYYDGETHEEAFANFERFSKSTAVILVTKQLLLWRACKSKADETVWLGPIRQLAQRLGDQDLCKVLASVEPAIWYAECNKDRDALRKLLDCWFESEVVPYLLELQQKSVRRKYLQVYTLSKCKSNTWDYQSSRKSQKHRHHAWSGQNSSTQGSKSTQGSHERLKFTSPISVPPENPSRSVSAPGTLRAGPSPTQDTNLDKPLELPLPSFLSAHLEKPMGLRRTSWESAETDEPAQEDNDLEKPMDLSRTSWESAETDEPAQEEVQRHVPIVGNIPKSLGNTAQTFDCKGSPEPCLTTDALILASPPMSPPQNDVDYLQRMQFQQWWTSQQTAMLRWKSQQAAAYVQGASAEGYYGSLQPWHKLSPAAPQLNGCESGGTFQ